MLTERTKVLVKVTLPLIKKYGDAIATKTYDFLFIEYPQVKDLFANAPQNQPQLIAKTILAYCEHVHNLAALSSTLDKIAQKHVTIGIRPEYYPMFGNSLLKAMKAVLEESITEEVIQAWKEAFFVLANVLIEREKELYRQQQNQNY